ncbi:MAG: tetratricopeptide repeat protein [Pseudomonadales bacterium]|nr:tetratricopeptide repeat protein [Pseudomonadales bacterium]
MLTIKLWSAVAAATATAFLDPSPCYQAAQQSVSTQACDELLELTDAPVRVRFALLISRALILERRGDLDSALADLDSALRLRPESALALTNRGNLYLKSADALSALRDYDAAVQLSSGRDPRLLFNRSFAHRALGNLEDAARDLIAVSGGQVREPAAPEPPEEVSDADAFEL